MAEQNTNTTTAGEASPKASRKSKAADKAAANGAAPAASAGPTTLKRDMGVVYVQIEKTLEVVEGRDVTTGDAATSRTVKVWEDLIDPKGKTPRPREFDSTMAARKFMTEDYDSECRFRIVTVRGPFTLRLEKITKARIDG